MEDIDSCMIKFSKCCTPVPGDDIIGFVTKGFGVSVHRKDCPNVRLDSEEHQGRWVNVSWADETEGGYPTSLEIESSDRGGMWLDIANVLATAKLKTTELTGRDIGNSCSLTRVTFEVRDLDQLNVVMQRIRNISGVYTVRRGSN